MQISVWMLPTVSDNIQIIKLYPCGVLRDVGVFLRNRGLNCWENGADLSLRLSYGSQGNVPTTVGPNLVVKYPTTVINRWSGEYVLNVSRYAYPDLRWEKTKTINIGTDFSFWKGRISGTIDYYYKKGKDIIFSLDVPAEYGVKTTYKNGADIKNTGFELAVSFVPVQTKDFK